MYYGDVFYRIDKGYSYKYMERYRRGRNELDSKSSCPHGHVGSNPTRSVKKRTASLLYVFFAQKAEIHGTLRVGYKANPLFLILIINLSLLFALASLHYKYLPICPKRHLFILNYKRYKYNKINETIP